MSGVYYDRANKRVSQTLSTIYHSDLEGEFSKVIANLTTECENYKKKYLEVEIELSVSSYPYEYLDGSKKKNVKFDKLTLDWQDDYDNDKQLVIEGERDFDAGELAALEKETFEQQEREKEHLRNLKKKYPND